MNSNIIEIQNLNFSYQRERTIADFSMRVPSGSIYCFLGPNGAGKTTTLRIILGLIRLKGRDIRVFNKPLAVNRLEILKKTGSLIEQPSLYSHLTGEANLEIFRLLYDAARERIREVLHITDLFEQRDKPVKNYSLGMKQRLGIAITLLHDPELLILDEPTNGLDPEGIIDMRRLFQKLHRDLGKTILISSHLLAEVEKFATHVGIIDNGRMMFEGNIEDLENTQMQTQRFEIECEDAVLLINCLQDRYKADLRSKTEVTIHGMNKEDIPVLLDKIISQKQKIYKAGLIRETLESFFMKTIKS